MAASSPRPACALALVLLAIPACGKGQGKAAAPRAAPAAPPGARFGQAVEAFFAAYVARHPVEAVGLGLHQHDGVLPDVSRAGLEAQARWLAAQRAAIEAFAEADLGELQRVERAAILSALRREQQELVELRRPERNPIWYLEALALHRYVGRAYAPLELRAAAVARLGRATPAYLAAAQANLTSAMPRPFLDTALLIVKGSIDFAARDVATAFAGLEDAALVAELGAALDDYRGALTGFRGFLEAELARATDGYAIGEPALLAMLEAREGLTIDVARLDQLVAADIARNREALAAAAAALRRKPAAAAALVAADRPKLAGLLDLATRQAAETRAFVLEHRIVTIPSEDLAEVRETPPSMRFNSAFLGGSGVLDPQALPAFYYITPPDPSWPKREQVAYVPGRADLLFTTVHELWPGHFLHDLHLRKVASKPLAALCSYAMVEGWAHYAEEMMVDQGLGGGDPKVRIGMLLNALLRDVRFASAVGLHARGMTVKESIRLFRTVALTDPATARQQAVRGTFDPGYLNYTLGKLMIRKLRDDLKQREGDRFSLQGFHDRLLSYGCAPLPAIRRAMLGDDSPAL